jgi:hypothetical protein
MANVIYRLTLVDLPEEVVNEVEAEVALQEVVLQEVVPETMIVEGEEDKYIKAEVLPELK